VDQDQQDREKSLCRTQEVGRNLRHRFQSSLRETRQELANLWRSLLSRQGIFITILKIFFFRNLSLGVKLNEQSILNIFGQLQTHG